MAHFNRGPNPETSSGRSVNIISWGNKQNAAAKIDESVKIGIWGYFCMRKKKKYGALRET